MKEVSIVKQIIHDIHGFTKSKIEVKDYHLTHEWDYIVDYARFTVCGVDYMMEFDLRSQSYQLYATVKKIRKGCGWLL